MMKPIKIRIQEAYDSLPLRKRFYFEIIRLVFPEKEYPNAFNYQRNGGPPGCAMAFGKALRQMNVHYGYPSDRIYIP